MKPTPISPLMAAINHAPAAVLRGTASGGVGFPELSPERIKELFSDAKLLHDSPHCVGHSKFPVPARGQK